MGSLPLFDTPDDAPAATTQAHPQPAEPLRLASGGHIAVGTASWTDRTLIDCGRFYPPHCRSAEARLRFYTTRFELVEVDSSYYAMPSAANAQLWAERTPPGFTMNVKAFRLFTGHQTPPAALHRDIQQALGIKDPKRQAPNLYHAKLPAEIVDELWRRFREALLPLKHAGRLGLVHFQFAPWVRATAEGRQHVEMCVERMAGFDVSCEFRHTSWFADAARSDETLAFERALGVAHTVVDAPQGFTNTVPPVWAVTHRRFALLRLHGRNTATWNIQGATAASDRFNYDYRDDELQQVTDQLLGFAPQWTTHVVFNNNMEDQGQRNATTLRRMLRATA